MLVGAFGVAFAVRPGDSAQWAYGLVALGVGFFGLSAMPQVREHPAYNALGVTRTLRVLVARRVSLCDAAFATAVCLVAYLGSGALFVGVLAVGSAVGTLVELYNWRAGTEYLRL